MYKFCHLQIRIFFCSMFTRLGSFHVQMLLCKCCCVQNKSVLRKHWKSALLCLALLVLIVTEAAPAKGGSKSMMKNRWILFAGNLGNNHLNFRGGSKGSGSRGSGRSNHPSGEDGDSGVGGSGIRTDKPPCVGLCYYNKLHGIPLESTTPRYMWIQF